MSTMGENNCYRFLQLHCKNILVLFRCLYLSDIGHFTCNPFKGLFGVPDLVLASPLVESPGYKAYSQQQSTRDFELPRYTSLSSPL
jgi:hypothetical protein